MTTFLDTSYIIALLRKRDSHHGTAIRLRPVFEGPLITTEAVLLEIVDSMATATLHAQATEVFGLLRAATRIRVVPMTSELLDEGMALFRQSADKDWGLTDCISFVVMRAGDITSALTADRHFEQAGFVALMRSDASGTPNR